MDIVIRTQNLADVQAALPNAYDKLSRAKDMADVAKGKRAATWANKKATKVLETLVWGSATKARTAGCPRTWIWLVKWCDRYWEPSTPSASQPLSCGGEAGRGIRSTASLMEKNFRTAKRFADMPADTLGVPMLDGGEDPAPAVVHREHPDAIGAPHRFGAFSDISASHGDCCHGGGSDRAMSRLFSRMRR